ncbi:TPA: site-specific DNA-methyltransferase, partial [Haemophilus influenzae]
LYTKLTRKRQEIFFNQTLAFDEIDRLFDAKAFSKFSRYTADGKQPVDEIKRHSDGTPAENLIIKGNNLIALHSLAKQFKGKIKLIYIDPPYNTGNDGFKYNDKFNHSTWLTFMKNRLEIARELLMKDAGVIFVSIDDNEQAYLKVLMDEVFGKENFLADIIWNSTKSVTNTAIISNSHTHNLVYFANKDFYVKNRTDFRLEEDGEGFSNPDNDPRGVWKADPFQVGGWRPNQQYEIINPNTGVVYRPNEGSSWKNDFKTFQKLLEENRIVFGKDGTAAPQRKRFLSEAKERGKVAKTLWDDVGTTTNGTQHLKELFRTNIFSNPKPEKLIKRIIELTTNENDIILDYHLGSGTTAAVAHKMNRQYIGIEQMDYIETLAVERLKKVIDGEQGGISKAVNWQGGGEFVYAELAPFNETAKQQILACENSDDIKTLFNELYERYFLKYNVSVDEFSQMINEPEFQSLPLDEQKQMMLEMLDLNQMYVSLSEIDDEQFAGCLNDDDKALSRAFYQSVKNQAEKKDGE